MKDMERHEHRYFCDSQSSSSVENVLDSLGVLTRIFYSLPITESIYFTFGSAGGYKMPTGMAVRMRMYASILSEDINISGETVILEVKRDDRATGLNTKERIYVPGGIDAIKALADTEDHFGIIQKLGLFDLKSQCLMPAGATQSYRCHWIHQSGMRVTFDRDVRFFLFRESLYIARMVSVLGEGKLEFKFPKANGRDKVLEEKIVKACGCIKHPQDYLERRARECLMKHATRDAGR